MISYLAVKIHIQKNSKYSGEFNTLLSDGKMNLKGIKEDLIIFLFTQNRLLFGDFFED